MIEEPGISLSVEECANWCASGPLADRALVFARGFERSLREDGKTLRPHRITVHNSAPQHVGLGTGTQLALAVVRAIADSGGYGELSTPDLAQLSGRGLRSSLGAHGFDHSGILVEGGLGQRSSLAPLVAKIPFPEEWRVVLLFPESSEGLSGTEEKQAFARMEVSDTSITERICRVILQGLLPAAAEEDFAIFSESVYEMNALSGKHFSQTQQGLYSSPEIAERIAALRSLGVKGVGQSSWGPCIFAFVESEEEGVHLKGLLKRGSWRDAVQITRAIKKDRG